jgi:hypothetical protein
VGSGGRGQVGSRVAQKPLETETHTKCDPILSRTPRRCRVSLSGHDSKHGQICVTTRCSRCERSALPTVVLLVVLAEIYYLAGEECSRSSEIICRWERAGDVICGAGVARERLVSFEPL